MYICPNHSYEKKKKKETILQVDTMRKREKETILEERDLAKIYYILFFEKFKYTTNHK